jgi:microcystin-dependent protein
MTQSSQSQPFLRIPALHNGRGTMAAFLALLLGIFAGLAPALQAQPQNGFPPNLMSYQGFLVDANGAALAPNTPQNFSVVFRIYGVSSAGSPVWTEAQTVTIDKGNFSVVLGEGGSEGTEGRPALSTVFNSATASELFLGITVKGLVTGNPEISPRLRLLTSPYAFLARTANSLASSDGAALISSSENRLRIGQPLQSTGGNSRGVNAVDLQVVRVTTSPGQVASGVTSVISGGQNNTASGDLSVIAGGSGNTATKYGSVVGGGENNRAEGPFATVPGGRNNMASGENSFAVGRRARATHPGSFVFGDNSDADKNSSADNQFLIQAAGGVSINGAPAANAALTVNGEVNATSAKFGSMNVAKLSATEVSGFGTVPLGGIIIWSGASNAIPAGWAFCDGRTINNQKTPDLRGRFVIQTHSGREIGTTGGAETITLTGSQLPAHNHSFGGTTDPSGKHRHNYWDAVFAENRGTGFVNNLAGSKTGIDFDNSNHDIFRTGEEAGEHSHTFSGTTSSVGSGNPIDKLPPFYVLAYIMRVQ